MANNEMKLLIDIQPIFGLGEKATQPAPIPASISTADSPWSEWNADLRHAGDVLMKHGVPVQLDLPSLPPTIALDRYTSGYTMAESFYAASHFVGWEDVLVGDPLCRPYVQAESLKVIRPKAHQ